MKPSYSIRILGIATITLCLSIVLFAFGMELTTHARKDFLAFRPSCDRCRYMKLKCPSNGNETHQSCQRYSRARLRCTYSRRTNLKKRTASGHDQESDTQDKHDGRNFASADVAIDDSVSDHCNKSPNSLSKQNSEIAYEPVQTSSYSHSRYGS